MLKGLDTKDVDFDFYSNDLLKNKNLISEYLEGLTSKNQVYMENCFNILRFISEKNPDFLYPYWEFFTDYIRSNNHYHKTAAIILISNLALVDKQNKFDNLFDEFYGNLKTEKTMLPMYLIKYSGRIIKYKPELEDRITNIFLNIEKIHLGMQIELVKSAVIESFSEYYTNSKNKKDIINFVKKQLDSKSPKTKKIAKEFLEKYLEK